MSNNHVKNDFFFVDGYDWEALSYQCSDCGEHHEGEEIEQCSSCENEDIIPNWNYEMSECKMCSSTFDTQEDLYSLENGDFEDVICVSCYKKLPDER